MIIDPYTWRSLSIKHVTRLTADTVSVRLHRPSDYTFEAGQYAIIRVNVDGMPLLRQYSFASAPSDELLEIIVQRESGGEVSNWFHDSAVIGGEVELSQPFGNFVVHDSSSLTLLIAGRVGIAPFLSVIRQSFIKQIDTPLKVLYSVRDSEQICYRELLNRIDALYFITSSGERIDEKTLKPYLELGQVVYVCGSKRFVDGVVGYLQTLGVTQDHIRRELFTLQ